MLEDIDTARLRPGMRGRARRGSLTACSVPGCPELTRSSYCAEHARLRDQARGSAADRGYDANHRKLRQKLDPVVRMGMVRCVRCGEFIAAGDEWHLDHTPDRRGYNGPAHKLCNLRNAA